MATSDYPGQLTLSLWQALRASNDIKCMLTDGTWVMDKDTSRYVSDVTGEVSGTGYTAWPATSNSRPPWPSPGPPPNPLGTR